MISIQLNLIKLSSLLLIFTAFICFPSQATSEKLPNEVYFSTGWCPRPEELSELSNFLDLSMNGCCIKIGKLKNNSQENTKALELWRNRITSNYYPSARCEGKIISAEEEIKNFKELEEQILISKEQLKSKNALLLKQTPEKLRSMNKNEFCEAFGEISRGTWIDDHEISKEAIKFAKTESSRRKLKLNSILINEKSIQIGISECELYAAWGMPERQNRTVGSWGVNIQHIYSRVYVYTQNGVVRSWQD